MSIPKRINMDPFQNVLFTTDNLNRSDYHDEIISYFDNRMVSLC